MAVVEFDAGDGSRVYVRVPDGSGGLDRAGAGDRVVRAAARTWQQSLEGMRATAEGALAQLRRIDPAPDEIKVSFGVTIDGKLDATVVSAGADAHLQVEVVWKARSAGASGG